MGFFNIFISRFNIDLFLLRVWVTSHTVQTNLHIYNFTGNKTVLIKIFHSITTVGLFVELPRGTAHIGQDESTGNVDLLVLICINIL